MPRTPDASSFTRFQKINAQSVTTTKNPTSVSVPPITKILNGTIGSTVKASTVAASAAPKTAVVATSTTTVNTKKRG